MRSSYSHIDLDERRKIARWRTTGRCRWHCRTQMDRRICRPPFNHDGAAWNSQRAARPRRAHPGLRHPPHSFIAFEYTTADPDWWYDIVDGLPQTIVRGGFVDVIERPGMGVDLMPERARQYLSEDARTFFG